MCGKIFLRDEIFQISKNNFPCAVHCEKNSGGSFFSIAMIADLFLRGEKILFFSAHEMAKKKFLQQIKNKKINFVKNENQFNFAAPANILQNGDEKLFLQIVKKLKNSDEQIIFAKNFSGKFQQILARKKILPQFFFNKLKISSQIELPKLKKFSGFFWRENEKREIFLR